MMNTLTTELSEWRRLQDVANGVVNGQNGGNKENVSGLSNGGNGGNGRSSGSEDGGSVSGTASGSASGSVAGFVLPFPWDSSEHLCHFLYVCRNIGMYYAKISRVEERVQWREEIIDLFFQNIT